MSTLSLSALIISVWLILVGAGVAVTSTATLIFGIAAAICAILSTGVVTYIHRP